MSSTPLAIFAGRRAVLAPRAERETHGDNDASNEDAVAYEADIERRHHAGVASQRRSRFACAVFSAIIRLAISRHRHFLIQKSGAGLD